MSGIKIKSNNFNGKSVEITFNPFTGGTINLGTQTIPYDYVSTNYEGDYSIYIPEYDKTCPLTVGVPPSPSVTPSITPTITPSITVTPTITPTPSITLTPTPTPSAPSTDPDYQAILDEATLQGYTLPSTSGQTLQNQLVVDLKSAGIWNDLDIFYVMATDGDGDFSLLNWIDPTSYSAIIVGSSTFISNQGWDRVCGDYIRTQYIPNVDAVNSTLDDTSMFVWDLDNEECSRNAYWSVYSGSNTQDRFTSQNPPNVVYYVNEAGASFTIDTTGIGFKMLQRTTGGTLNYLINSGTPAQSLSITPGSGAMGSFELNMGRNGTGNGNQSQMMISIGGRGASLEGKETDLYNAINTYISSL